jgi:hypothetical protein
MPYAQTNLVGRKRISEARRLYSTDDPILQPMVSIQLAFDSEVHRHKNPLELILLFWRIPTISLLSSLQISA